MAKFTGQIAKSVTSTTVGVGALVAAADGGGNMHRAKLLEFIVGSDAATLGTANFRVEFQQCTSQPTATLVTPFALDPGDVAPAATHLFTNASANGTLTSGAIMMTIPMSEQATVRYVANPGSEIIIPAASGRGIHFMTPVCGNNPSIAGQVTFEEL